jgi:hypothetical protein
MIYCCGLSNRTSKMRVEHREPRLAVRCSGGPQYPIAEKLESRSDDEARKSGTSNNADVSPFFDGRYYAGNL